MLRIVEALRRDANHHFFAVYGLGMKLLEIIELNQKRTSKHNNLILLKHMAFFADKDIKIMYGLSQRGIFRKGK